MVAKPKKENSYKRICIILAKIHMVAKLKEMIKYAS